MIPYALHVSVLICCLFALYKFLLEKETFFRLNRALLLSGILLAFLLPLYQVPATWSIWESPQHAINTIITTSESLVGNDINQEIKRETDQLTEASPSLQARWSIGQLLWFAYGLGVVLFGIHFLIQLGTLLFKIIRLPNLADEGYHIVELDKDEAPFSFLNYVFINPEKYDWETYNQVIEHEKIHIRQVHSLDMILAELLVVFQWYNPAAWQYRKLIENNLEFLTDSSMLEEGTPSQDYQLNLLKVSVPQYPIGLAMNYNQSILKKRIHMMNKKKSSVQSSWKYLMILPILTLSVISLNTVQATTTNTAPTADHTKTMSGKTTSPIQSESASFQGKTTAGTIAGVWYATEKEGDYCIQFQSKTSSHNNWHTSRCFDRSEFTNFGSSPMKLIREAGEVQFEGTINGDVGTGEFTFVPSEDFKGYLRKTHGYSKLHDELLFHLFTANINRAYFSYMKRQGYDSISEKDIHSIAIHGLTLPYVKEQLSTISSLGIEHPSLDKLLALRIHGVNADYMTGLSNAGMTGLSLKELLNGRIHGVDPDYVHEIRSLGYADLEFQDFVEFRIHGVNRATVSALGDAGYRNLSARELKEASIHGINEDYIKGITDLGFENLSLQQIKNAKIHGIRPEAIREFRKIGFDNLPLSKYVDLRIHGVDVDFVKDFQALGFKDITAQQAVQMRIHGVTPEYIKKARAQGKTNLSLGEYRSLKIHGARY